MPSPFPQMVQLKTLTLLLYKESGSTGSTPLELKNKIRGRILVWIGKFEREFDKSIILWDIYC